jgi:hypothetical protein
MRPLETMAGSGHDQVCSSGRLHRKDAYRVVAEFSGYTAG